jgi:CPA1 family monovalent cation:H+ antiporter
MTTFIWIIVLLLGAVALTALARRLRAPYPTFLAIGGACLAFIPDGPRWTLDPTLALALFVAPVLMDAAYDTSLRDVRDNWQPIANLVLTAVVLTTLAVAFVARGLVSDMPWAAAIALGAIVAPPDASAAITILRQARLPHRLAKILEGEGLLNDATALLIYRVAVGAAASGGVTLGQILGTFAISVPASLIAGYVLGRISRRVLSLHRDAPMAIISQFCSTFAVWILADEIGLSAILTLVVYAVTVAWTAPIRTPARIRVPAYAVWETAVFVLNVLAFVLIGMQVGPIFERLDPWQRLHYGLFALAVLATVIIVRIVWAMAYNTVIRARIARHGFHPPRPMLRPSVGSGLVVSWTGMRGIVTLAAAFALPEGFPHRDLILLTAFCVVLGTMVIQGLTLRPLIERLNFDEEDPVAREVAQARVAAYRAALTTLDGDSSDEAKLLRKELSRLLVQAEGSQDGMSFEGPLDSLRLRGIAVARRTTYELRISGEIGDDAYHVLEEEFDWAEMSAGAPGR